MLDPLKLRTLTNLREEAGLTLSTMAMKCGLKGTHARITAGAWEQGRWSPRETRRMQFIGYLWDDLKLREDPGQFYRAWDILVEEWGWEPISETEQQEWGISYPVKLFADSSDTNQINELLSFLRTVQRFEKIKLDININIRTEIS